VKLSGTDQEGSGRDFKSFTGKFAGINPGDFGRYGRKGYNGRMGVVEVVGNDQGRSGFFSPQGGVEIDQEHSPPSDRGRHR